MLSKGWLRQWSIEQPPQPRKRLREIKSQIILLDLEEDPVVTVLDPIAVKVIKTKSKKVRKKRVAK